MPLWKLFSWIVVPSFSIHIKKKKNFLRLRAQEVLAVDPASRLSNPIERLWEALDTQIKSTELTGFKDQQNLQQDTFRDHKRIVLMLCLICVCSINKWSDVSAVEHSVSCKPVPLPLQHPATSSDTAYSNLHWLHWKNIIADQYCIYLSLCPSSAPHRLP